MQRSALDDLYSLSSKMSCKDMISKFSKYQSQANNIELLKYSDPHTGKVNGDLCIYRNECPLCDSKDFEFLFIKHGFDHMLCHSCDLIFTHQILDQNKIKFLEVGDEGDVYGEYKENNVVNEMDRKKFEIVFDKLEQFASIKNIFDFGSASGTFLDWAQEKYDVTGHEYHDAIRKIIERKGHKVRHDNLETIRFDKEFDVITCWDYLDHVLNPKKVIANLTKYLKKGGIFFFAINNRNSLSTRMLHKDSPIFIGPHHTMHYGIKQTELLMKGYELVYSESYVSELNWLSNWLNFKNPEFGDSPLMYDLLDPKKICELGMGFKVNAFFRKL